MNKILNFWPKSFKLHWEKSSWVTIWNWYSYTLERLGSQMSWLRWTDMCWVLRVKFSLFCNIWCLIFTFAPIYLFHSHVLWYFFFMLVYCIYCMAVYSLLLSPSIDKPWSCNVFSSPLLSNVILLVQCAKKVMSDSPGLVDFAIGLANSVFNLPDGQVMFFEEFE